MDSDRYKDNKVGIGVVVNIEACVVIWVVLWIEGVSRGRERYR